MTAIVSMVTTRLLARRRSYQRRSEARIYSARFPLRRGAGSVADIFDGLTIVEEAVDAAGWRARLRVETSSRAFAGHFEGQPILPGVASSRDRASRAARDGQRALQALPSVRFRQPVRPGRRPRGDGGPADAAGRADST